MKVARIFLLGILICLGTTARAQVWSQNIVGYINQDMYPGDNLIANQLSVSNDTLNAIFQPGVPEGATFTEWDPATQQYLPASVYDTTTGWSIDYTLSRNHAVETQMFAWSFWVRTSS